MKKIVLLSLIILSSFKNSFAQQTDSAIVNTTKKCSNFKIVKPYVIPALLFTYGLFTPSIIGLKNTDLTLKQQIVYNNPHKFVKADNYIQYAPALSVYALNVLGNKGKHSIKDASKILLISHVFTTVSAQGIKRISKRLRPDSSSHHSFPSGHTAEAFANATFLMMEYKHKSIWYGIAGYAVAATTAYLRMYNNKHWLSDVVAGAGVGIASAQFAYWIYPKLSHKILKQKNNNTVLLPSYSNKTFAINMVYNF
jgi:PAP2 superfamily